MSRDRGLRWWKLGCHIVLEAKEIDVKRFEFISEFWQFKLSLFPPIFEEVNSALWLFPEWWIRVGMNRQHVWCDWPHENSQRYVDDFRCLGQPPASWRLGELEGSQGQEKEKANRQVLQFSSPRSQKSAYVNCHIMFLNNGIQNYDYFATESKPKHSR